MVDLNDRFDPDTQEFPLGPDDYFWVDNVSWGTVQAAITGNPNPEEVRKILSAMMVIYRTTKQVPQVFHEFLEPGLRKLREGKVATFDEAIGLTTRRGRGRPRMHELTSVIRVTHVLKNRLKNMTHENAVVTAAAELGTSDTRIREAWRDRADISLAVFKINEHCLDSKERMPAKHALANKIFYNRTVYALCIHCNKNCPVRVPVPRANATLPWRPRCAGCGQEFEDDDLQRIRIWHHDEVMGLRDKLRSIVRGVLRRRRGPPRFPAVE